MSVLYHHIMLPQCRLVRVVLDEKGIDYTLKSQNFFERDEAFLAINPAGNLPVFQVESHQSIIGAQVICEYIEDISGQALMGASPQYRAEVRRLCEWFHIKFENEVTNFIAGEKIYRRLARQGEPDPSSLRAGATNLVAHLRYISWLLSHRHYLAGASLSLADFAAATQLSVLDYLGEVPWQSHLEVKNWYANIKCRPSFQKLLHDRLAGFPPARHYANLDF